ncbi:hypothetical protein [uncultured Bacteroides sp.]|uniref:hypothetical protein n=1 Tax=uncultured Bacteroides sp. TaxID=162156 RepID=UPI002628661A|nr:hypothetical protein [uncultured Bacteroides sp.]
MMKAYINIKNDSDLHSHQTLNKRIGLMKRERQHNAAHRFSFGERFDETLMKGYCISCLYIRLSNHQIIGISPLIKSAVGTAAPSLPVCCCADRQSCRHNGTEYHTRLAKRKGRPTSADIIADTAAGFWERKAIAH